MGSGQELNQAIYSFLRTQIQFGYYRYMDNLPTMEELCWRYHISIDTVKPAYHRLRQEGMISLSQRAGAKVAVRYGAEETERHIRLYFAQRKSALLDLDRSLWPLFGWAQWLSIRHGVADTIPFDETGPPDMIWRFLEQKYAALGNELLMRLMRYIYLFFHGPFYSVRENGLRLSRDFPAMEWDGAAESLLAAQEMFSKAVARFYEEHAAVRPDGEEEVFRWNTYRKSSQLRYTLAIEILTGISRGVYPPGSWLPPAAQLSAEKGVSVSTVRRTISLLNSIGAVKSSRPLGARVLPPAQSTENCDFSQPDLKRRLLDLTASLQIYALSSKAVSALTLASLDARALDEWKRRLLGLEQGRRHELVTYTSLELIAEFAPYQAIRTIYGELLRLLFWGNPLRGMRGNPDELDQFFAPYFGRMVRSLETKNAARFSGALEELLLHELRVTVQQLKRKGIREVGRLLVPSPAERWGQ